jgi:hypothetical protein
MWFLFAFPLRQKMLNIFPVLIDHLYFFIWELPVQFFFPFIDWTICSFWCFIFLVLYIFRILIPVQWIAGKDFLPFCKLSLHCQLYYFLSYWNPIQNSKSHCLCLYLEGFRPCIPLAVSKFLTWRSLIPFELIFVQGERLGHVSIFYLLISSFPSTTC